MVDDESVVFYQFYTSYWSQMVRMAAVEKGIPFETIDVDPLLGEVFEPDFVRINPECEIPVMKIGRTTVCGSQEIIDYLDRLTHRGTDADVRPHVDAFRRRCVAVPITEISLGVIYNPQLLEGAKLPEGALDRLSRKVDRVAVLQDKIANGPPDLAEIYRAKLVSVLESEALYSSPARLQSLFRALESFLDETDLLLRQNSHGNLQEERWLFGAQFTNADIVLACLLARVDMIGFAGRCWDETERLFIADYYGRLKKRQSFQQECVPMIDAEKYSAWLSNQK